MNAPLDHHRDEMRYAEYALGVLDAVTRTAVEREIHDDPQAAMAVAQWQRRLSPLVEDIAAVTPAPYVWARIQGDLGLLPASQPAQQPARAGLWNNLRLWRWIGIGASLLASAAIVAVIIQPRSQPAGINAGYMAASIRQDNGIAGWTATVDMQHHRLLVVPATPAPLAVGKSAELWLIPPGGKPMSLGVIARDRTTAMTLRPDLFAWFGTHALLAVSVEPAGGSPTGQPTGSVIAKGTISGT